MIRLMRDVFMDRLTQEARVHRVLERVRKMEAIREHISRGSDGVVSPRFALLSPRRQHAGLSVCGVEWPQGSEPVRLRRVLLTAPQLHELHRRAARLPAGGGGAGGGSELSLEPLYVVAVSGKYRRRDSLAAAPHEVSKGGQWRGDGSGASGLIPWGQLKRWTRGPILIDAEDHRDEQLEREHAILRSRARVSLVGGASYPCGRLGVSLSSR